MGKGGAGKSVVSGTLARVLARRGHRVLALDSDTLPGMEISLGADPPVEPPLLAAAERGDNGRWRYKPGIGPVRAVQRFSTPAPDGVRLLQAGKLTEAGRGPLMGAFQAYYRTIHALDGARALRDWTFVGDLPAGPRQVAFDWVPFADTLVLIVEPTVQSVLTARRIVRIATGRVAPPATLLVVNQARTPDDVRRVERMLGEAEVTVPADPGVASAERLGVALVDHVPGSPAVAAITELAERLERGSLSPVSAR